MDDLLSSIRKIMAEDERTEPAGRRHPAPSMFRSSRPEPASSIEEAVGRSLAAALDKVAREAAETASSAPAAGAERMLPRRAALRLWGGAAERGYGERRLAAPPGIIAALEPEPEPEPEPEREPLRPRACSGAAAAQRAPSTASGEFTPVALPRGRESPRHVGAADDVEEPVSAVRPAAAWRTLRVDSAGQPEREPHPRMHPEAAAAHELRPRALRDGAVRPRPGDDAEWPVPRPAADPRAQADAPVGERPLQGVGVASDRLPRAAGSGGPGSVEDLVRDMMRPMLKTWLDANLAEIVEREVQQEIRRLSAGH